jgi:cation:H+ antiporter
MSFLDLLGNERVIDQLVTGFSSWGLIAAITLCIVAVTKSADLMINGAIAMARLTRLPEIIIGATILSLGTTLPEVFVSVMAAWTGNPGLALGNGVGSIICDTGMILGLTCLLSKVPVDKYVLNRAGLVQVGAATLVVVLSLQAYYISPALPTLQRWVGILFLVLLVGYLYLSYRWSTENSQPDAGGSPTGIENIPKALISIAGGLGGVVIASRVLIPCAAEGAVRVGVPQDVVATTLVAFGTSLPELVTAIMAVRKGHPQIMIGNVVGADVLNCLFVIGAAAVASPLHIPPNFYILHFPAMLLILYSFRFFVHINKEGWFTRIQGAWILGIYLGYLALQYRFNTGI